MMTSSALEAQDARALARRRGMGMRPLRQRRVQVDRVRHHRRADDPDGEVERARCRARSGMSPLSEPCTEGPIVQRLVQEAERR